VVSQADSILSTQSVRFVGGNVIRTAYLEDYPFPYYLVIRDTAALPEALSDALRQWFAMVGGREE
jgi:midasin